MGQVIDQSKNKKEKGETYSEMFREYNGAMRQGFYLQAIFIIYAMMEDRINSFLLYSGLISPKKDGYKLSVGKANKLALELYWRDRKRTENSRTALNNISNRIVMLKNISIWADNTERDNNTSEYESDLLDQVIGTVDLYELRDVLEQIELWRKARNECVHGLMHKNLYSVEEKTKELAEQGMVLVRRLDEIVKGFKKNNNLRKKYNIQPVTW